MQTVRSLLSANPYPGRGILMGVSPAGRAVLAYFIMGRSERSRSRLFVREGVTLRAQRIAPDERDASLIEYTAFRPVRDRLILSNGTHGDCIAAHLVAGGSVQDALEKRTYEPDAPHFTPRISGMLTLQPPFPILLSILRNDGKGDCLRLHYEYPAPKPGEGYLIHTYSGDGDVLPAYTDSPACVAIPEDMDLFAGELWDSLHHENRVSLFLRYTDAGGAFEERIINGKINEEVDARA